MISPISASATFLNKLAELGGVYNLAPIDSDKVFIQCGYTLEWLQQLLQTRIANRDRLRRQLGKQRA